MNSRQWQQQPNQEVEEISSTEHAALTRLELDLSQQLPLQFFMITLIVKWYMNGFGLDPQIRISWRWSKTNAPCSRSSRWASVGRRSPESGFPERTVVPVLLQDLPRRLDEQLTSQVFQQRPVKVLRKKWSQCRRDWQGFGFESRRRTAFSQWFGLLNVPGSNLVADNTY